MKLWIALLILSATAATWAGDAAELLQRGDALDREARNREALELYLQAEQQQPGSAEVLRRVAKQYNELVPQTAGTREKRRLATLSYDYARRAVAADPKNAAARLSLAICAGRLAFFEEPRRKMELSRTVREEAERALQLDPRQEYAWHVLGRWHYEVVNLNALLRFIAESVYGRLPEASLEAAATSLEKAVQYGPPRPLHHAELGRVYAAQGRRDEARRELELALRLPPSTPDDRESQQRARDALRKL